MMQNKESEMQSGLESNEQLIKQGAANLQRGVETVGGHLHMTNTRLVFESHSFNVQTGATVIPLSDITETTLCWTKFLNLIPVFPNSLEVKTVQGDEHRFVLFGRGSWKQAIDSQRAANV